MEPYIALNLSMLSNVTTSYSNMWWSESLRESIEINKGFELKVLTGLNLSLDTAMSQGRYIPFPTFPPCSCHHQIFRPIHEDRYTQFLLATVHPQLSCIRFRSYNL